jgi:glutaredoxin
LEQSDPSSFPGQLGRFDGWVVFGHHECGWCHRLLDYLKRSRIEFTYYNVREDLAARSFLNSEGLNSVPQAYHNAVRIGGYEATKDFLEETFNA